MIPKIIHYVWVNDNPFPDKIKWCIDSWKEQLPNYQFIKWDKKKIDEINQPFPTQAIEEEKWAFAADFTRLYALYNYGGIYLDTDVRVFKSFDPLLHHECFIGREKWLQIKNDLIEHQLTAHCIGSIPKHPYIKKCLDYYLERNFRLSNNISLPEHLRFDFTTINYVLSELLKEEGYSALPSKKEIQSLPNKVVVYPIDYFDCEKPTNNSFCKHYCMSSWRPAPKKEEIEDKKQSKSEILKYKVKYNLDRHIRKIGRKFNYIVLRKP